MNKLTTTLNEIGKYKHYSDGWKKLLSNLNKTEADDEPLPFLTILESNGLHDTLRAMRVQPNNPLWRHFAVDCAEQAKHSIKEPRSLNALVVARKHTLGEASDSELYAVWGAAARAAVGDVAWAVAWADERAWQTTRLKDLLTWGGWRPLMGDKQ